MEDQAADRVAEANCVIADSVPVGLSKSRRLGLLALLVALNLCAIVVLHRPWDFGQLVVLVAGALGISQAALYALWAVIAPISLRVRLFSVPIAAVVLFAFFRGTLVAQCAWTVLLVWCLLFSGFRLVQVDENDVPVRGSRPFQFDLKRLLIVMTGTCVASAIMAATRTSAFSLIPGAVLALMTFPAMPALLIPRRANAWGAVVLGVGLGLGLLLDGMTSGQGLGFAFFVVMLASEMLALLYVRKYGYRLRRATG